MPTSKQVTAARKAVREAKKSPTFKGAHDALAVLAVGIAEQIDGMPSEDVPASLWKEYRAAVEALVAVAVEVADESGRSDEDDVSLPKMGNQTHTG